MARSNQLATSQSILQCSGCHQAVPSLHASEEPQEIGEVLGLEPNDPAVVAAFDRLVLRGHLKPFLPDWWEQI